MNQQWYHLKKKWAGFIILALFSCNSERPAGTGSVSDGVGKMMQAISADLSANGPGAWLNYFENNDGFFMASEGHMVFANNDSANKFVKNTLVKSIRKIDLRWNSIRIDSIGRTSASIGAAFHEDLFDDSGDKISDEGYFTALAMHTDKGWKLRNAHWSVVKK